jgi:hypothetical protein
MERSLMRPRWFDDANANGVPDGHEKDMRDLENRILGEVRLLIVLYLLAGVTLLVGFAIVERLVVR